MIKTLPYSSSLPRLLRLAYSALKTNNDAGAVYGTVDTRSVRLTFEEAGRIATFNVQEGQTVPEGNVMGTTTIRVVALHFLRPKQQRSRQENPDLALAGAPSEDIAAAKACVAAFKPPKLFLFALVPEKRNSGMREALFESTRFARRLPSIALSSCRLKNRRPTPDKESVDAYSGFSKGLGFKNSLDENLARAHHGTPFGKDVRQLKVLVKK